MNCSQLENDLALYAGGDLPGGGSAAIEAHLEGCLECRILLADLHANRALLRSRDEDAEAALAAEVRHRVMESVGRTRASAAGLGTRPTFGWRWGLALAAGLVVAGILIWPSWKKAPVKVARDAAPASVAGNIPAAVTARVHHRAARTKVHADTRKPAPQPEPLLVQFVTDNPNVVIYWIVDRKPQGD
jgi:anti-sigma factor RsiW